MGEIFESNNGKVNFRKKHLDIITFIKMFHRLLVASAKGLEVTDNGNNIPWNFLDQSSCKVEESKFEYKLIVKSTPVEGYDPLTTERMDFNMLFSMTELNRLDVFIKSCVIPSIVSENKDCELLFSLLDQQSQLSSLTICIEFVDNADIPKLTNFHLRESLKKFPNLLVKN